MASSKEIENQAFISNFSPVLVWRILLTDPDEYSNLTMSGQPRSPTITFQQLIVEEGLVKRRDEKQGDQVTVEGNDVDGESKSTATSSIPEPTPTNFKSIEDQVSETMRQAFHDCVLEDMKTNQTFKPVHPIILEIHSMLRSLIPNRKDLHNILDDDDVQTVQGGKLIPTLNLLKKTAEALIMLESEERSESTREWMDLSFHVYNLLESMDNEDVNEQQWQGNRIFQLPSPTKGSELDACLEVEQSEMKEKLSLSFAQFALASATFIHTKTEMCQVDVADYQLGCILAPRIAAFGKDHLIHLFEKRFGKIQNDANFVPNLKIWLTEIVKHSGYSKEELMTSDEKRGSAVLQNGWIDNIIFRSPRHIDTEDNVDDDSDESQTQIGSQRPFFMPEIFYLDIQGMKSIRMTAKISVVGSALALHASALADTPGASARLKADPLDARIEECRKALVKAMNGVGVGMSQELYESNVGDAVVQLVEGLNPNVSPSAIESVRRRTTATMRGEDPVLKLLDNRMRGIFREMIMFNPLTRQQIPTSIRTGRNLSFRSNRFKTGSDGSFGAVFKKASREEFVNKGFSFYADELAEASLRANRVMNLSLQVYGSAIIEKVFLDVIRES